MAAEADLGPDRTCQEAMEAIRTSRTALGRDSGTWPLLPAYLLPKMRRYFMEH